MASNHLIFSVSNKLRLVLSILILFSLGIESNAQGGKRNLFKSGIQRMRHLQGLKGLDMSYGVSALGPLYGVGGILYVLDNNAVRVNGTFEDGELVSNDLRRYIMDLTYTYTPIDLSGFVFINLLGGATVNYSTGTFSESSPLDEGINFGALAGLEIEAFIAGMVSFFVRVDQRVHVYDNYGRWRNYSLVGLRVGFK